MLSMMALNLLYSNRGFCWQKCAVVCRLYCCVKLVEECPRFSGVFSGVLAALRAQFVP